MLFEEGDGRGRTVAHWAAELGFLICSRLSGEAVGSDDRGKIPLLYSVVEDWRTC